MYAKFHTHKQKAFHSFSIISILISLSHFSFNIESGGSFAVPQTVLGCHPIFYTAVCLDYSIHHCIYRFRDLYSLYFFYKVLSYL